MSEKPRMTLFPSNCCTQPEGERQFSYDGFVCAGAYHDPVYTIPPILYSHSLEEPRELTYTWSSSDSAICANTGALLFPNAFSPSDPLSPLASWAPSDTLPDEFSKAKPKRHRAKHSARKPQPLRQEPRCDSCNKRFTRKHDLLRHITSVHWDLKPFTCTFQPCRRAFPRKDARDVISF